MKIDGSKFVIFGFFAILIIIGFAIYSGIVTKNIITGDQVKTEKTRFTITNNEVPIQEDKSSRQSDTVNESKEDESEIGETTDSYELGISVFSANCLSCHGEMGVNGQAPNLQISEFAQKYDNVVNQVKNGGTYMPPFEELLSEEEIEAVARYVNEVLSKADE